VKRRVFLRAASAGVAVAASWPSWLRSAFAQSRSEGPEVPADITDRLGALSDGFRRAHRAGKPLLVLVIPADEQLKWQRGTAFGELVNHGGDVVMQNLALAEVVCAPMDAVRTLVPQAPTKPADPLMVLIETDALPAQVQLLHADLAVDPEGARDAEDDEIDARIATLSGLIQRALLPNAEALERRAAQVRQSLGAARLEEIDRALKAGSLTREQADRGSAHVLSAARARRKAGAAWQRIVAEGASARIQHRRIPGSHWARSGGCGTEIEDWSADDGRMYGCGMGHVSPRSARFLTFFAPGNF